MRNAYQKDFFEKLSYMQEETVQIAFGKYKPGDDVENLLYEVTYDVLAELMTWIDGYGNFCTDKMDIVNMHTGKGLKQEPFIELHDVIADYLKWQK